MPDGSSDWRTVAGPGVTPPAAAKLPPKPKAGAPGWFAGQLQELKGTPAPEQQIGWRKAYADRPDAPGAPSDWKTVAAADTGRPPDTGIGGSGAEFRREYAPPSWLGRPGEVFETDPRPLWARGLETGITGAAATIGSVGGAALGAPLGPVGAIPGAIAGATATMTYADWINKKIDEKYGFAPVTPVTREGVKQAAKENLIAAATGEIGVPLATKTVGGIGSKLWSPHFEFAEGLAKGAATPEELAKSQEVFEQTQASAKANTARVMSEAREKALTTEGLGKEARREAWQRQFVKPEGGIRTAAEAEAARKTPPVPAGEAPDIPVQQPAPAQPTPAAAGGPVVPGRTGVGGPPLPPEPGQYVRTPEGDWVRSGEAAAAPVMPPVAQPAPAEAAAAAMAGAPTSRVPPGPAVEPAEAFTQRQHTFWNSIFDPVTRNARALGAKFEQLFRNHLTKQVETAPIINEIAKETRYAADHLGKGEYSPTVEKIFDALDPQGLRKPGVDPNQIAAMEKLAGKTEPGQEPIPRLQHPQEVQRLLAIRSQIVQATPKEGGPNKAALTILRESIDDALTKSGHLSPEELKRATALRERYRSFKSVLGPDFYRDVSKAQDPVDAIPALMSNPQRSQLVLGGMTPQEKQVARGAFQDWMLQRGEGGKLINMGSTKPEWNNALKQLGFEAPFNNSESWVHLSELIPKDEELIANSPDTMKKLDRYMEDAKREQDVKEASADLKVAADEAGRIGGIGEKRIKAAIEAARTPQEKLLAARRAFEELQGMDVKEQTRLAALRGEMGPTPLHGVRYMIDYLNRALMRYGPWALLIPGMLPKAAVLGVSYGSLVGVQSSVDYAIRSHPEFMLSLYRALHAPLADSSLKTIANLAVKGIVETKTAQALKAGTGASLSTPGPTNWYGGAVQPTPGEGGAPGPTSSAGGFNFPGEGTAYGAEIPQEQSPPRALPAISELQNREIAPTPSGADRAGEIDKALRTGRAPVDVSQDLARGRLSSDEVNKLLQRQGSTDPGASVAGIPLTDLMSAAETGSLQEKRYLVPRIQQRMMQELPKLANKTTQANLSRRFRTLQREAQVGMPQPAQSMQ